MTTNEPTQTTEAINAGQEPKIVKESRTRRGKEVQAEKKVPVRTKEADEKPAAAVTFVSLPAVSTIYDTMEPDAVARLKKLAEGVAAVDKKSTAAAFELGRFFQEAFDALPFEQAYETWVKEACNRTAHSSRQYRRIAEELWDLEDRMVALTVPPTVMMKLSEDSVGIDQIEAVLDMYERGERMTVSKVKRFLSSEHGDAADSEPVAPEDLGGNVGLERLIRQRLREDKAALRALLAEIATSVSDALAATPVDRQVKKGKLQDEVFKKARLANAFLGSFIFSRMPDSIEDGRMVERRPAATTGWMRAHRIIERLGEKEAYPAADKLREWLELDVLPTLAWMMAKDIQPPMPERQPAALIELPARQAEPARPDEAKDTSGLSPEMKAMMAETLGIVHVI